MKKLILLIIALLVTFPTFAQTENNPIAIVLDGINHDLIMVYDDGTERIINLPLPDNVFVNGSMMTISPDATLAAFCWGANGDVTNYHLTVLNLTTTNVILEDDYGTIQICNATAFSTDSSQLAVATVTSSPIYDATLDVEWALSVYDIQSGNIVAQLGKREAITDALTIFGNDVPVLATVKHFDNDTVTFAALPYVGMGGVANVPAFTWNIADDSLIANDYVGNLMGDTLPVTDEVVFPALNENFAAAMPDGPLPQANEVHIFDGQSEQVIYRNTDWTIVHTQFISGGDQIAIVLLEDASDGMKADGTPFVQRIVILQRDGAIIDLPQTYENYAQIGNITDGGIVLWSENTTDGTPPISHLRLIYSAIDGYDVWTYQSPTTENGYSYLELVWTKALETEASYPPFPKLN